MKYAAEASVAGEERVPVREILLVKFFNVEPRSRLRRRPNQLYVEFHHRGKRRGSSLPLNNLLEASRVTLPLRAAEEDLHEPLKCQVKRSRRFLPDSTLFTVDVDLRDNSDQVYTDVKDRQNNTIGTIMIEFFETEWTAGLDFDAEDPRPNQDLYLKLLPMGIKKLVPKFFIGGAENLIKPRQAANPDLPTIKVLNNMIEYPNADEFVPQMFEIKYLVPIVSPRIVQYVRMKQERIFLLNDCYLLHEPYTGK